jgi:hypothetical protein
VTRRSSLVARDVSGYLFLRGGVLVPAHLEAIFNPRQHYLDKECGWRVENAINKLRSPERKLIYVLAVNAPVWRSRDGDAIVARSSSGWPSLASPQPRAQGCELPVESPIECKS